MQIEVSDRGEIVLPGLLSQILGVRAGDSVDASYEDGRIVLTQRARPQLVGKIVTDPITGLPVLDYGPDAPVLTSEMVGEILADFP